MKQAIVRKGRVLGENVPKPNVSNGAILIKVVSSCISAGTEMSGVSDSGKSLIKRALEQPANVKKVFNLARSEGISKAYATVKGKLDSGMPTGYSISGVVVAIGCGVTGFSVGDAVAAAGAGLANHAEYVDVPQNLVMKMPKGMDFVSAATVTLGGIAMQGVRRADMRLGELCVVVGAGILGLLSVQMLRLSGIRVAAVDFDDARLDLARDYGAELTLNPKKDDVVELVNNWTGGFGADCVLFTAATSASDPLSQAFQMCKRKGKVVLVGVVGMQIERADIYPKELDFQISTSYGPGRYDMQYEAKGLDYPYAYVRWTENRNMVEYLRLLHNGQIKIDKMISNIYPFDQVAEAFESLKSDKNKPLMVILDYGQPNYAALLEYADTEAAITVKHKRVDHKKINVALVGAGNFAAGMHLPNMKKMEDKYQLRAVVNRTGHKAKAVAEQYGAQYATTNFQEVLDDDNIDLILISTRHDSHANLVLQALRAGKHVFVEKPLAVNQKELDKIRAYYSEGQTDDKPLLFVGFNRRFSKYVQEIKRHLDKRINPLFIHYRMNAGFIPSDSWVHEDGGRLIGEGCHLVDLATFLTGARVKTVSVSSLSPSNEKYFASDNKSIILTYDDGSIVNINYFAVGNKSFPKEYMEVHYDGKTIVLDDYKAIRGYGIALDSKDCQVSQKGQLEELEFLHSALTNDSGRWPICLADLLATTELTFCL